MEPCPHCGRIHAEASCDESLRDASTRALGDRGPTESETLSLSPPDGSQADTMEPYLELISRSGFSGPREIKVGSSIGRYEILEELGRGGMGVVYRARDRELERQIALKVLLGASFAPQELHERFRREGRSGAALSHPGIVAVLDVGEFEGCPYLAMDLIEGPSLDAWLISDKATLEGALEIVRETALALDHAHQQGIVHRDIKPSNILIDSEGYPRIADFGLARDTDVSQALTMTGAILGTPLYMSPEQATGRFGTVGPRSDLYSLGIVLYEVLTERPPFMAKSTNEILLRLSSEDPVPPRRLNPRLHRDLEAICLTAIRREPARRYATAAELADDLERYLERKPVRARPPSLFYRLRRTVERHPIPALLLTLLILVGLPGLLFFLTRPGQVVVELDGLRDSTRPPPVRVGSISRSSPPARR